MFKIFNKITNKVQESLPYTQTDVEVIEEIHNSFDKAGDELLIFANKTLKECAEKDIKKGQRMSALGFTNTKEAVNAKETIELEEKAKKDAEVVQYYQNKYPNYKFITKDIIKKICEKYNLVFGESSQYKGNIPDKNLKEIENFQNTVKEEDFYYTKQWSYYELTKQICSFEEYKEESKNVSFNSGYTYYVEKRFKICAPLSDMNTEGYKLQGHKLIKEVPDPIVLFPVNNGYLIVSKWGLEANDGELANPLHN